jgi:predicted RND superfamily exporter protein
VPPLDRPSRAFVRLLRHRRAVLAIYALLVPLAGLLATRIENEGAIERLVVTSDPDYAASRAFEAVFPESQVVLVVVEADDAWSASTIARVDRATAAIARVPNVSAFSVLEVLRGAHPGADPARLRTLATGTAYFQDQVLVGDRFLTIIASLDVSGPAERDAALAGIDLALAGAGPVRRIGAPYVDAWIERQSANATTRSSAIFGVLLLAIALVLYRSIRALLAILLALGAAVTLALAAGALLGFSFTIVSALVPLTVMVTTLATLTYLHSRFIDQPEGVELSDHHVAALRSKLVPVTASTIAAAAGFAALAVSSIRPIREMGIWTALGLVLAWAVAYTLFPVLQSVLRTPTTRRVAVRTATYDRIARVLPQLTYRHRWSFVVAAGGLCIAGAIAIAGVPGVVGGIPVQVDALSNIDPASTIGRDMRWFREHVGDLDVTHVWIQLPAPTATQPEVLRAIDRFDSALAAAPGVIGVTGPTTPLRLRSYLAGHGEVLPRSPAAFASAVADVEQLLLTRPELRGFIDPGGLADVQLTILFRSGIGYAALAALVEATWQATAATSPALAGARVRVVGEAMLAAKITSNLVPTLAESFVLTVAIILLVFLIIFRSGTERLLAMIPSVFAILVTLLGLRLFGGSLNVATIIIATTVLGTTENDQMHLFHHMHERTGSALAVRLRHTLRVAGPAVLFATLINAAGFLGLSASSFPPLQQFGVMTAAAFVLAMIADFTVLPAALWIASRERPGESTRDVLDAEERHHRQA